MAAPQWNLTLHWPDFHFNAKWNHQSPKPQLRWSFPQICLCTVASSNQQLHFFSQISLIVLIMPRPTPIGIRHEVLALACGGIRQSATAGRMGLTCATVNRILWWHVATGNLVPGKSEEGSLERNTSSRPCFVEDGPTGSLHKCSGLDGADEELVWYEGWPENHQYPALFLWLPCLWTHKKVPVDCQPPSSPLVVGTEVAEPDNGPLVACHLRWRVQIPTLPSRWQV